MTQSEHVDRSGFLSEDDKRKFTMTAGILGCVFFVVQVAGPILVIFAMMPVMMFGNGMKNYAVRGAALFRGELYVVETAESFGPSNNSGRPSISGRR